MPQAFFKFTLKSAINPKEHAFAISVQQQGERLKNYRLTDQGKKFVPSSFNISLMTESGEWVMGRFGQQFNFSLMNENVELKAGKYIIMVDPLWNESANLDRCYKEVMVDIYAPEAVYIDQVDDAPGFELMAKALKRHALANKDEKARSNYLSDNEDYGTDVLRVQDIESLPCWYGYIYTKNDSSLTLRETLRPELEGMSVIYPIKSDDMMNDTEEKKADQPLEIVIKVPPGQDNIVILRRATENVRFALNYLTHAPELTDE